MKWAKHVAGGNRAAPEPPAIHSELSRLSKVHAAIVFLALGSVLSAPSQNLTITSCGLTNGNLELALPGHADSYYLLLSTPALNLAAEPVSAMLGAEGTVWLGQPVAHTGNMFFRVEQLPLTATNCILGDGIPDGFKLLHGLPVFGPSETNVVPLGDIRTWLQIYQAQVSQAALPLAYFPAPSYPVIVGASNVVVPVSFTKAFTGQLTYQLSGTAIPNSAGVMGDYIQPANSVTCNNASSASITIALVPQPDIEVNRSIVIALRAPPSTNQTYTITTNSSVTSIQILQSTQGVFVGSLAITNGLLSGAQSVKMALRPGAGGGMSAVFDVTGNALLGNMFSVPVTAGAAGFQLNGAWFTNGVTKTPWGGNFNVKLAFGLTQTNGAIFSTPVTMTLAGLTASGVSYSGSGTLTLCRSQ